MGTGCPKQLWLSHPWKVSKARLEGPWSHLGEWKLSLSMAGVELNNLQSPFQLQPFRDSVIVSFFFALVAKASFSDLH